MAGQRQGRRRGGHRAVGQRRRRGGEVTLRELIAGGAAGGTVGSVGIVGRALQARYLRCHTTPGRLGTACVPRRFALVPPRRVPIVEAQRRAGFRHFGHREGARRGGEGHLVDLVPRVRRTVAVVVGNVGVGGCRHQAGNGHGRRARVHFNTGRSLLIALVRPVPGVAAEGQDGPGPANARVQVRHGEGFRGRQPNGAAAVAVGAIGVGRAANQAGGDLDVGGIARDRGAGGVCLVPLEPPGPAVALHVEPHAGIGDELRHQQAQGGEIAHFSNWRP